MGVFTGGVPWIAPGGSGPTRARRAPPVAIVAEGTPVALGGALLFPEDVPAFIELVPVVVGSVAPGCGELPVPFMGAGRMLIGSVVPPEPALPDTVSGFGTLGGVGAFEGLPFPLSAELESA